MPSCEKCYAEARTRAMCEGGDVTEHYYRVMKEAEESGQPCTPREKAGQWSDEERQCDSCLDP